MAEHEGEHNHPQSAVSTQLGSFDESNSRADESILSDTQPTEHEDEDTEPLHNRKLATSDMEDMSLDDGRPQAQADWVGYTKLGRSGTSETCQSHL